MTVKLKCPSRVKPYTRSNNRKLEGEICCLYEEQKNITTSHPKDVAESQWSHLRNTEQAGPEESI